MKKRKKPLAFEIVPRWPTLAEFVSLIDAVGWPKYTKLDCLP